MVVIVKEICKKIISQEDYQLVIIVIITAVIMLLLLTQIKINLLLRIMFRRHNLFNFNKNHLNLNKLIKAQVEQNLEH